MQPQSPHTVQITTLLPQLAQVMVAAALMAALQLPLPPHNCHYQHSWANQVGAEAGWQ